MYDALNTILHSPSNPTNLLELCVWERFAPYLAGRVIDTVNQLWIGLSTTHNEKVVIQYCEAAAHGGAERSAGGLVLIYCAALRCHTISISSFCILIFLVVSVSQSHSQYGALRWHDICHRFWPR